jgi:CRISPR-associated protein Cmr1
MLKITIPLETVTPLFLGGSDPRGAPELRPASFRGALRFWLRALLGASLGVGSLKQVSEEEAKVFGDAGQDSGSPIIVRATNPPRPGRFSPLTSGVGLRYLLFSMGQRERDRRTGQTTTIWRDCFPPQSTFELTLQSRSPAQSQEQEMIFKRAAAALWLLVHLGSLGARSRRGAGCLRAASDPADWRELELPALALHAATPAALSDELQAGLRDLRQATGLSMSSIQRSPSPFDVLHPDTCDIHILDKTWHTWQDALETVGAAFQAFRNRHQPDYDNVKDVVSGRGQRLESVRRAAFGLPIVFYFRSLKGARGTLEGAEHDRRASPLLIKVVRLANGQHTAMLTVFRASLLDPNERLKLRPHGRPAFAPAPGLDLIDEFLEALSSQGTYYVAPLLEVNHR